MSAGEIGRDGAESRPDDFHHGQPSKADKARDSSSEDALASATFKACTAAALTMPSQAEDAQKATVVVKSGDSIGSGVLISEEGLVLTASHVIQDGELRVTLRDGTERDARVVRTNAKHDVALLQVWGAPPHAWASTLPMPAPAPKFIPEAPWAARPCPFP